MTGKTGRFKFPRFLALANIPRGGSVEGPFHEKGKVHPLPDLHTYREGLQNMCAGFFLGRVDLVGKQ